MTSQAENQLVTALESVALPISRSVDRIPITAASPEQIELVHALRRLADLIPALLPKVITGEVLADGWSTLADALYRAARLCREQVVIDTQPVQTGQCGVDLAKEVVEHAGHR